MFFFTPLLPGSSMVEHRLLRNRLPNLSRLSGVTYGLSGPGSSSRSCTHSRTQQSALPNRAILNEGLALERDPGLCLSTCRVCLASNSCERIQITVMQTLSLELVQKLGLVKVVIDRMCPTSGSEWPDWNWCYTGASVCAGTARSSCASDFPLMCGAGASPSRPMIVGTTSNELARPRSPGAMPSPSA